MGGLSRRRAEARRQGGSPAPQDGAAAAKQENAAIAACPGGAAGMGEKGKRRRGQAAFEFALMYGAIILPLTFGIVYVAEMYWVWHSMVEFTRDGARYAATHCFQTDTQNVIDYMQANVPVNIDQSQFKPGGSALITVQYQQLDPTSGILGPIACEGDCGSDCVPDAVTVSVTNYEFTRFVTYLHLPPVVLPPFPTSMPVSSGGCNGDNGAVTCNP